MRDMRRGGMAAFESAEPDEAAGGEDEASANEFFTPAVPGEALLLRLTHCAAHAGSV